MWIGHVKCSGTAARSLDEGSVFDGETNMEWLTPDAVSKLLPAIVPIIAVVIFVWKVANKADIKSLKADIKSLKGDSERNIQSLKSDTRDEINSLKADLAKNIDSLKTDIKDDIRNSREELREVRQNLFDHVSGHPNPTTAKNKTQHTGFWPPDSEELKTREKGEFTADEHDNRTGS